MKKKYLIILSFPLLLSSCNKMSTRSKSILVEQIFGMYDLGNEKKIILNSDYSYIYFYVDSDGIKSDLGIWYYHYYIGSKTNQIKAFDMRALGENGERNYYTRYSTFTFYVCKHWGKIIITNGYEGDPDGAPALKWFKKID